MSGVARFLTAAAMMAALNGAWSFCGAATIQRLRPTAQPVIYGLATNGTVAVYSAQGGKRLGQLQGPPASLIAVDGNGNVFAGGVNNNGTIIIEAYAPGSNMPSLTLNDGMGYLNAMAAATNGEVAAVRYDSSQLVSYLDFFASGTTSPSRTIQTPFDYVGAAAYEPDGTLWIHGYDFQSSDGFGYVPPGGTTVTLVNFPKAPQAGPIAIDAAGNIVTDQNGLLKVYSGTGTLVYTVRLGLRPANIQSMAFSSDKTLLYVADPSLQIEVYRYRRGSLPIAAFGTYSVNVAVGSI